MSIKLKGIFQSSYHDHEHNPTANIITDAVVECFTSGTSVAQYIRWSRDIRDFLIVRTVNGGAQKDGVYVGKIVRFYYSLSTGTPLNYETSGNRVPKSQGAMPLMDLPEDLSLPEDLDYVPYIKEAEELLETVNCEAKTGRNKRVAFYTSLGLNLVPWPWRGNTIVKEGHDFSATPNVGIQTGYRANTIAIRKVQPFTLTMGEWSFYQFNDARYPGAMKTVAKKLGFDIMYGGAIEVTDKIEGKMIPLPDILLNAIFNSMGLAQRRKAVDGMECLL